MPQSKRASVPDGSFQPMLVFEKHCTPSIQTVIWPPVPVTYFVSTRISYQRFATALIPNDVHEVCPLAMINRFPDVSPCISQSGPPGRMFCARLASIFMLVVM